MQKAGFAKQNFEARKHPRRLVCVLQQLQVQSKSIPNQGDQIGRFFAYILGGCLLRVGFCKLQKWPKYHSYF
jgi:hypothetical protein